MVAGPYGTANGDPVMPALGTATFADPLAPLPHDSILELCHALKPADRRKGFEDPGQLRMRRHMGLDEHRLVWLDPTGQVHRGQVEGVFAQHRGVLWQGDGVQVDDAKDVVVLVLVANPVADRSEVVADVKAATRLDPAEDAGLAWRLHPRMLRDVVAAGVLYISWIV